MTCRIKGVRIEKLYRREDSRGWLTELFRHDELPANCRPVMAYASLTRPGAARGPHEHLEQTDLFCFIGSSTFRLYLWDNRSHSPTCGMKCVLNVDTLQPTLVMVPPGVVHAYVNVGSVDGLVFNAPNRLYAGEGRQESIDEIRHEDDPSSPFKIE